MPVFDRIMKLTRQLYPKGRVFKIPFESDFEKMHEGLAASETRFYDDTSSLLDSILPDNDNFTVQDATDWERRLGLITNTAVSLDNRKTAILRKMNHPGTIPARQHFLYIEGQLQLAGFNVFVHENTLGETPGDVSGTPGNIVTHGQVNHGSTNHGTSFFDKVANSIDSDADLGFATGANLLATFFIGGAIKGDFANLPKNREIEFRQLILKLKPAQTIAFLFIQYI